MRKLLLIVAVLSFAACSKPTQYEVAKKNIEDYLKPQLNDPASYEFVSMDSLSPVMAYDTSLLYIKKFVEPMAELKKELYLSSLKAVLRGYGLRENMIKDSIAADSAINVMGEFYDRLRSDSSLKNTVVGYKTKLTMRSKNGFNATVMESVTAYLKTDLSVIKTELIK